MQEEPVHISCDLPWWFWWYVRGLVFFCNLFGTQPDWHKLECLTYRSLRFNVRHAADAPKKED